MEFSQLIQTRRSIRVYSSQPIEEVKLSLILEAANRAPSAGNLQAYEIFLARSPKVRAALASAAGNQQALVQAPVALVFCAHPDRSSPRYAGRGARLYSLQDATIACTFPMLAAADAGLATVWAISSRSSRW